jgi:putative acetyltransferase
VISCNSVEIRAERAEDVPAIAAVAEAAFGSPREARMLAAIRGSSAFVPELSLVAVDDGSIVGHVILSYVDLEGSERRLLELGPLSVRPDRQGSGVGGELVRAALAAADARREPLVLVLGDSGYYSRFGFRRASELGITKPEEAIPDDAFMAVPLEAYDASLRGRVVFPDAYKLPP